MSKYYRTNGYGTMVVEVDGLRIANRGGAKDAAITATYNLAIDRQLDDSIPILYSQIERGRHMTAGSGTRNADCIVEQKYPPTEQDLEYTVQTGRWLYPVMGDAHDRWSYHRCGHR
jgi:hypothetical protein